MREREIEIRSPALQKKRLCITSIITTYNTFHSATLWTSDKPISALGCVSVNLRHLYWITLDMLKYKPRLVQNSYISLNIPWRDILKLTCAQSFHSTDVWLELLWFWAKGWGWGKGQQPIHWPLFIFLFFTMLKCCKTWTTYINFLTYISWHIKKFIYLCIAVNVVCVCIYIYVFRFKFIYNALLQKCEPLFPSLAVLWNKSSAVSLSVKLPFFENLTLFNFFS